MNYLRLTLFVLFASFCAVPARADFEIKYYLTITNVPAGLTTNLVANIGTASTRHWTNDASGAPSAGIQITNTTAAAATNLLAHLNNYPVYSIGSSGPRLGVDSVASNTSTLVFTAPENTNLTVSFGGNWARGFYVTNPLTAASTILWPTNAPSPRGRTNAANAIINYLGGTVPSNSIPPANFGFRHYTDNTSAQTLSNKTFTGAVLNGGRFINATNLTGTNVALTNVTLHIANITAAQLSGLIAALTNGTAYNLNLVNATNRGIVAALTNGLYTNATFIGSKSTNFINYGSLGSRYSASAGQAFGEDSIASGVNSTALGRTAEATGVESTAGGYGAQATTSSATAYGNQAVASGEAAVSFGYTSVASGLDSGNFGASGDVSGDYSFSFGYNNTLTHSNTTLIGNNMTSTADNLVEIGSGGQAIALYGPVTDSTLTNTTLRGVTTANTRLDFTSGARTSLANGYNSGTILGTNVYIRLSGASAAATNAGFAAELDGSYHIVQVDNPGLSYTILHDSGLEASAANRIYTGTGALVNSTNNPVILQLLYDATASRHRLISIR